MQVFGIVRVLQNLLELFVKRAPKTSVSLNIYRETEEKQIREITEEKKTYLVEERRSNMALMHILSILSL